MPVAVILPSRRRGSCQHTVGFQSSGPLAGLKGAEVKSAAGACMKVGPIQEDAGVVDEAGGLVLLPRCLQNRSPALAMNCQLSAWRRSAYFSTRSKSSSSRNQAPIEQQPCCISGVGVV